MICALAGSAFAAYPITGTVYDSNSTSANGRTVKIYYSDDLQNFTADVVGPSGVSTPPSNVFIIDLEQIPGHPIVEGGKTVMLEMVDDGSGFIDGPVNFTIDLDQNPAFSVAPDMTLTCAIGGSRISIFSGHLNTNNVTYYLNPNTNINVIIYGVLSQDMCSPISNRTIAIQINDPFGAVMGVDQKQTGVNGEYSEVLYFNSSSTLGTYNVHIAFPSANTTYLNSTSFTLLSCPDQDSDGSQALFCGGPDCDDSNSNVKPGQTEACNGIDDNCNGQVDEGVCGGGGGGGGGGSGSGGGSSSSSSNTTNATQNTTSGSQSGSQAGSGTNASTNATNTTVSGSPESCTENWECTDWSACSNDIQTRTCADNNGCGTELLKPQTTQACTAQLISPTGLAFSNPQIAGIGLLILLIILALLWHLFKRKKSKNGSYNGFKSKKK